MKFEDTPEYKDIRIAALLKENAKFIKVLKGINHVLKKYALTEINWDYHIFDPIEEALNGTHVPRPQQNDEELQIMLDKLQK